MNTTIMNSRAAATTRDLPPPILDIVARVLERDRSERNSTSKVLAAVHGLPNVKVLSAVEFHVSEYHLQIDLRARLKRQAKILDSLANYRLAAVEQVVTLLDVASDDGLLVTRYAACAGERLNRVVLSETPLNPAAQERFVRDMQVLAEHGLMHPYAVRGFYHWWMSSRTGCIVLDHWSAVAKCKPEDVPAMMLKFEQMFRRRSERLAS